jgi:hypothetical protein
MFYDKEICIMKKAALSLLVVFAAFIWACEDGLDDRASMGTAYASASPEQNVYQFDLLSWDNSTGPCIESIKTEGITQSFVFNVWPNPIYKGELSRVKIIKVESKYTPLTPGAPALSPKKLSVSVDLFDNIELLPETIAYTADNATFARFNDGEMEQILISYINIGNKPITYVVDYKFTLFELSTGIEDDLFVKGILINFADYDTDNNCSI